MILILLKYKFEIINKIKQDEAYIVDNSNLLVLILLKFYLFSNFWTKANDLNYLGYNKSCIIILKDYTDLLIKRCATRSYWICLNLICNCIL